MTTLRANGEAIENRIQEMKLSDATISYGEIVNRVNDLGGGFPSIVEKTLLNARNGERVQTASLKAIAEILGFELNDIVLLEDTVDNPKFQKNVPADSQDQSSNHSKTIIAGASNGGVTIVADDSTVNAFINHYIINGKIFDIRYIFMSIFVSFLLYLLYSIYGTSILFHFRYNSILAQKPDTALSVPYMRAYYLDDYGGLADHDNTTQLAKKHYNRGNGVEDPKDSLDSEAVQDLFSLCHNNFGLDLRSLDLRNVQFSNLHEKCGKSDYSDINFSFSTLSHNKEFPNVANFARSNFTGASLAKVEFRHAEMFETKFDCAEISGSDFSKAQNLRPNQLEKAFCRNADFCEAKIPEGFEQPLGCRWISEIIETQGVGSCRALDRKAANYKKIKAEVIDKFYYKCLQNITK